MESTGGLIEAQQTLQRARFGPQELAMLEIRPGRIVDLARERDRPVFALRASAPWPELLLHNGADTPVAVGLRLHNVAPDAEVEARLGPLDASERSIAACTVDGESPLREAEIAPPSQNPPLQDTFALELALPPCSTLRLQLRPSLDADALRFLLVAAPDSRTTHLTALVEEALALEADAIVLMGGFSAGSGSLEEAARPHPVPIITLAGNAERAAGLSAYQQALGPTDFHFLAGARRILVLNTIAGTLSGAQFALVRDLAPNASGDVTLLVRPPLAPARGAGRGLQSDQQGIRLLSLLRARGTSLVVSASSERAAAMEIDGVRIESLGRQSDDRLRLLLLPNPWRPAECDEPPCGALHELLAPSP